MKHPTLAVIILFALGIVSLLFQTSAALTQAYLRVTHVSVPERVFAGASFTLVVSVDWSAINYFVPPPYVIRVEICEGRSSELATCVGAAFVPSEDGEKVGSSGSRTYTVDLKAPKGIAIWYLTAIIELLGTKTGSTLYELWRGPWVVMSWGGIESWREFPIEVRQEAILTVQTDPGTQGISVSVDGTTANTDATGSVRVATSVVEPHTIEVPAEVTMGSGARIVFANWSDGGASNLRTILLTDDTRLVAEYTEQYFLTVSSAAGNPQGAGWYNDGSTAIFSVSSPLPVEGLMGMLGARYILHRWTGDSDATDATASIKMDGPKSVTAEWRIDNAVPYAAIASLTAAFGVIAAYLVLRRRQATIAGKPTSAQRPASVFCIQCGAENPSPYRYCGKCGAKLEVD